MTTALSPDTRRVWLAARGPVLVGAMIVAAAIVITLLNGSGRNGALEPDSATPSGSRALARLLQGYGVRISRVDSARQAEDALAGGGTLLVTQPDLVDPEQLSSLRREAATTVAIGARGEALEALTPLVHTRSTIDSDAREPGCSVDAARAAGVVRIGGVTYSGDSSCYEGTLVQQGSVTLLGDATPLTNAALDEEGDAALSLRLLGQHEHLIWYVPKLSDVAKGDQSFYDLVPRGWSFGLIQAAIAVLLFMLWRGRRLGPVVVEPLPVVVRAAETTEGRARLYRRAGATDHAAAALREATVSRLIPLLGLPSDAQPSAVAERVAERTGRPGPAVFAVLFGPAPASEQALVRLADDLDELAAMMSASP
jgi:hypothetical protein